MNESFLTRLPMNEDLLEAITKVFREKKIRKAAFTAIGAISGAVLGFYDESHQYVNRTFDGQYEIVSCMGNVSEKDGEIFAHAHIVISDSEYRCFGGHLMPGAKIFAAELTGTPVPGDVPVRKLDEPTGLALWSVE